MRTAPILRFGQFIGSSRRSAEHHGFFFTELVHLTPQHVPEHTHVEAHFIFIVSGDYLTAARSPDSSCGRRTLIFNPPGTTHRDRFHSATGHFFAVSVTPARYAQCSAAGGTRSDQALAFQRGDLILLAARALREFRNADALTPLVLEGLALQLLGYTARHTHPTSGACPAWLRRARELIQDKFTMAVSVGDIAAEVGVHPCHLARWYGRYFGQTPGDHLRGCRVQRAGELLQRTRMPIGEVALACGYSDQSQFTWSFSRATGVSPGIFRRDGKSAVVAVVRR